MNDLLVLKLPVPKLGVVRWLVQFCSVSFFHRVCASHTRWIWSVALWSYSISKASVW